MSEHTAARPVAVARAPLIHNETFARLAFRPKDAGAVLGVCRATIYEMVADGRIKAKKIGAATVIPHSELARVLDEAPYAPATLRAFK